MFSSFLRFAKMATKFIPKLMKAALLTGIRKIEIGDLPEPQISGPHDVLLRVGAVGVCGSDLHYYTQGGIGGQRIAFPETLGHECAGTVMEMGASVTSVKPGDQVAIDPLIACGECDQCLSGRPHTCRHQKFLGCPGQAAGALAELLVVPEGCCYPVPPSMSMEQAVMVEPFSIGLYAARMAGIKKAMNPAPKIAILGAGPIGLCVLLACLAEAACNVYVSEPLEPRRRMAIRCGAAWAESPINTDIVAAIQSQAPLGVDVAFECAGQQSTLDQAVHVLKPGGALLIVGIPEVERVSFNAHEMRRKEISIWNVRRQNECTAAAVEMIASGKVDVDPLMTHRFPLRSAQAAFDLTAGYGDGVIKSIMEVSP